MEPNLYQVAQFFFFKDDKLLATNNDFPDGEEDLGGTSVFEVLRKKQPLSESERLQNYEAFLRIFRNPIFPIVSEEQIPRIGI